jgi:hypothetical protein
MDPKLLNALYPVLPGYITGPYAKISPLPKSVATMGTNDSIRQPINLDTAFAPNCIVDVRDVACGHVLALGALPFPASIGNGRFIINGATYPWSKAAVHLKDAVDDI